MNNAMMIALALVAFFWWRAHRRIRIAQAHKDRCEAERPRRERMLRVIPEASRYVGQPVRQLFHVLGHESRYSPEDFGKGSYEWITSDLRIEAYCDNDQVCLGLRIHVDDKKIVDLPGSIGNRESRD